ncbi:GntR family transcriptional regulator [Halobacillus faecis]
MFDRKSPKPMFEQISDFLKNNIANGIYEKGAKIPTEAELMERFNVSRTTVRLAIKEIQKKDLVEIKRGKGTFVKNGTIYHSLEDFKGLYESLLETGKEPQTKLLGYGMVNADLNICEYLNIDKGSEVLQALKLYHIDEEPLALAQISMHPDLSHLISEKEAEESLVYKLLSEKSGFKIKQAHFEIFATNASKETADKLGINENDPLLGAERILYSDSDSPIEHSLLLFRYDKYRFTMDLKGKTKLVLLEATGQQNY